MMLHLDIDVACVNSIESALAHHLSSVTLTGGLCRGARACAWVGRVGAGPSVSRLMAEGVRAHVRERMHAWVCGCLRVWEVG